MHVFWYKSHFTCCTSCNHRMCSLKCSVEVTLFFVSLLFLDQMSVSYSSALHLAMLLSLHSGNVKCFDKTSSYFIHDTFRDCTYYENCGHLRYSFVLRGEGWGVEYRRSNYNLWLHKTESVPLQLKYENYGTEMKSDCWETCCLVNIVDRPYIYWLNTFVPASMELGSEVA